ncbi:MAG TPA: kelch repeat-containing protein, partial [Tepidisphaeraceae bacterium]
MNFSSLDGPAARGHKLDYGATYSRRGNGLTYGWSTSRINNAVVRDDPRWVNPKAESNIVMGRASWNIAVPNGWYDVKVLMGDPSIADNVDYRLDAEGSPIVKGRPYTTKFPFVEGQEKIQVTDGKLTLTSNSEAVGNRLAAISILATPGPTNVVESADIAWSITPDVTSPVYRAESGAVRVGDKLYVMGGFTQGYNDVTNRVDILDIKTNTWTQGRTMPGAPTHFGAASDGRFIYLAGGQYGPQLSIKGTSEVWRYDIARNRWQAFGNLPEVRFGGQMSYVNGKLHFFGGNDTSRVRARAEHWILDLARTSRGWQTAPALPQATDHHSQIVVNNQLYCIGGEVEHGTSYLSNAGLFRYDDASNRWETLASMPVASSHVEAATVTDGKRIFL